MKEDASTQQATPTVNPPITLQTVEQTTQKEAETSSQEYQNMHQDFSIMNKKLATTENTLVDLNAKMDELALVVEELQKEIIQQKEATEKAKQELLAKKAKPKARPIPVYHLKAIVPDRAWIESDEGMTETIRVGDSLYGYGVVEIISPRQGMVVTSNGSVIQYGVNDY
jgi:intracellular multiplication protein IcmG